jgi:rhamnogalacturonyl hydrolase YesR
LPVPYDRPTTQSVTDALERVRARLEAGTPMRIIEHPNARQSPPPPPPDSTGSATRPAADPAPTLDRGPEGKFSPVSYAMGVVYSGMLQARTATGDPAFGDFVARRYQFLADEMAKVPADTPVRQLRRNALGSLLSPRALDDCGSMGAAFIKARRAGIGPDLYETINRFADYISHKQLRLADGTLARNRPYYNSVWGDDAYMSVPFLAQMGALTGNTAYFDDATRQILQMSQRLFIPQTGLFTHAWNEHNADDHPRYYWGRANGWVMMAMVELLDVLPEDHPNRPAILHLFRTQAQAVASLQSGSGLWHQMLDRPDSYLETSCSAIFTYCLARGVDRGWLDGAAYGPVAQTGWNGLTARISEDGRVTGTCIGTSYADDYVYYYSRPAADDVHGYGPVLLAGSEMIHLLSNDEYKISGGGRGGPFYYQDKQRDVTTQEAP